MDRTKDKVGYEINFSKYFYKFSIQRSPEEIANELQVLNDDINRLVNKIDF